MDVSLSLLDLQVLLPGVPILTYSQLQGKAQIEDILGPDGRVVVLYLTTGLSTGHWVGIWMQGNHLCYFDSYGLAPDKESGWLSHSQLVALDEDVPLMRNLFKEAKDRGIQTSFSKTQFQDADDDSETCGRHVAVRLQRTQDTEGQYRAFLMAMGRDLGCRTADEVVVALTQGIIGK